jgi:hypothetical protein
VPESGTGEPNRRQNEEGEEDMVEGEEGEADTVLAPPIQSLTGRCWIRSPRPLPRVAR